MKCQRCKEREASVQIIQQTTGKKPQTFILCDVCASELGISIPKIAIPGKLNTNPFSSMGNVFQSNFGLGAEEMNIQQTLNCDQCGMTFDEFKKTGFLGCSHCYEAFASQMDPVFCRTQMGKKHVGRKLGRKPGKGQAEKFSIGDFSEMEWTQTEGAMNQTVRGRDSDDELSVVDSEKSTEKIKTPSKKKVQRAGSHADPNIEASEALLVLEKQHTKRLIEEKKAELSAAVSAEDYLNAAKIRDELDDIMKKMKE